MSSIAFEGDVPAVQVVDLTKRFGAFTAVDRVSLSIGKGEIVGFIGPNGAGKSTTIRMLCGLLHPSSGRAWVGGFDVGREPEKVRAHIGYMSQKFSLYDDLTVWENLRFFAGMYHVRRQDLSDRLAAAVAMAGLRGRENSLVGTLAAGWKQRLALGCAILHRPPVLFLDEPTSGVEPEARRRFWDLIHGLAGQGVTVLVSTHYMDEAEYCNRIALINAGRLIAIGSPGELRQQRLGGELFELACQPLGAALAAIRAIPEVVDAAIFGDRLHILLREGQAVPDFALLLQAEGIQATPAHRIAASLEDVFVQLVSHEQGAHP